MFIKCQNRRKIGLSGILLFIIVYQFLYELAPIWHQNKSFAPKYKRKAATPDG